MEFDPFSTVVALAVGYLLGSIPFGLLLTRLAGTADIRTIGSGNIGATNVLRTGRKDLAAATLLLDGLKGTAAVLLARAVAGEGEALATAAAAFLGHLFPVWLGFRGGKGVATFLGCALGLWWPAGLGFAAVWLLVAYASRYSSAAALAASVATPVLCLIGGRDAAAALLLVLAILVWWKHRPNIERLLARQESRIGGGG